MPLHGVQEGDVVEDVTHDVREGDSQWGLDKHEEVIGDAE